MDEVRLDLAARMVDGAGACRADTAPARRSEAKPKPDVSDLVLEWAG